MRFGRILRNLFTPAWSVRRRFPAATLRQIERAIGESEQLHAGQIRFVVEHSLDLLDLLRGLTARERAIDVFSHLRVWDTEHNNGVLIYLLLADRDVEIIADRGIHGRAGAAWEPICRQMEAAFRKGEFATGTLLGIRAVGEQLAAHFPRQPGAPNELPDRPLVL
jgi:uncharacterized membrane protein YgcG